MLWLALQFPRLPLEALASCTSASAVVARGRIVVCDPQAAAAGIMPGQKLSTALGLLPSLQVLERQPAREAQALHALAQWAGRFTPTLSLQAPDALWLEIGGCLRLFGGAHAICDAALAGCQAQGWSVRWALAPTPLAASWLARQGGCAVGDTVGAAVAGAVGGAAGAAVGGAVGGILVETADELQARLAEIPCAATGWPAEVLARLEAFGLRRLGELRRLPSAALRQRLGSAAVDELLQAWGELPHLPVPYVFPERFSTALELPARVEQASALVFAGQRLIAALSGWLQARRLRLRGATLAIGHEVHARHAAQAGNKGLAGNKEHEDNAAEGDTVITLRPAQACADEARLLRLLREQLEHRQLAAPAIALRLSADDVEADPGTNGALFDHAATGDGRLACLERLQARLGEQAVLRLQPVDDYRPECAAAWQPLGQGATQRFVAGAAGASVGGEMGAVGAGGAGGAGGMATGGRPLWLLPSPQGLPEAAGLPHWHGPLRLLSRAERLESGWWDEGEAGATGDVRRDYFVACNAQGQWAWIFRDAQGWYLHGLFA